MLNKVEELESNSSTLGRRIGMCVMANVDMVVAVKEKKRKEEGREENELWKEGKLREGSTAESRWSSPRSSLPSSSPPSPSPSTSSSMTIQDKHKKAASAKWKKSVPSSVLG